MEIKTQRREYLKLRHNRILQGLAIKIAFSIALIPSAIVLSEVLEVGWIFTVVIILTIAAWTYIIYQTDSWTLIKMERELGYSKEDKPSKFDIMIMFGLLVSATIIVIIIFVMFLLVFLKL